MMPTASLTICSESSVIRDITQEPEKALRILSADFATMSTQIERFDPPDLPAIAPSYSMISMVSLSSTTKLISLAGQVGHDATTKTIPSAFADQVKLALANVDKCLAAAGASKKDIITNRQYVVRLSQLSEEDFKARSDIVLEWLDGAKPPPDTLLGVESLAAAEYLFEIEVQAVVHS